jgi:hypothetical protein
MIPHTPGVIHVVTFFGECLGQPNILEKPVPIFSVGAVLRERPLIVATVLEENANGFLYAIPNDVRVGVTAADIREE